MAVITVKRRITIQYKLTVFVLVLEKFVVLFLIDGL